MNRLHKISVIPFITKYYICLILILLSGCYKNGIQPFIHGYSSFIQMVSTCLMPVISLGIGYIFDKKFKNNDMFNSKFYSLLFVMIIPISTNFIFYLLFLTVLLFGYNYWIVPKKSNINWIVLGKIVLVLFLILAKSYSYQNNLESSGLFQYSIIDSLFGYNVSGMYISNTILILISFIILELDEYYKKEIPLYSYGIFAITVTLYSFVKQDMHFLLTQLLSSNILFALTFIATLSNYTPYTKKLKIVYSIILGLILLPASLITNFYEGIYISIIFANGLVNLSALITEKSKTKTKYKKEKQN